MKIIIKTSIFALISCLLLNVGILTLSKKHYKQQIESKLQNVIKQQHNLLQRLSKNLLQLIVQGNIEDISLSLRAYEDLIFALSKQNLAIPISLHFVSFTAPQQVIGSNGSIDNNALAPDDAYYLRVTEAPGNLILSRPYVKAEMPEYLLCNWGLGIVHNETYYGQLDVKVALEAVKDFINKNLPKKSKIFDFKISSSDMLQMRVTLNSVEYIKAILFYLILELAFIIIFAWLFIYLLKLYAAYKSNKSQLIERNKQLEALQYQANLERAALAVQYQYGLMQHGDRIVDLNLLLHDIHTVNAPLALTRKVQIILPGHNNNGLQFQGDQLRLMQILASTLQEIILQLVANCSVNLQLLITDLQQGMQLLQFKFSDDGFYNTLQDRQRPVSSVDVASQGWNNIYNLIELEEGTIEHQHTAYGGNTVSITIVRKVAKKVINIENYYTA